MLERTYWRTREALTQLESLREVLAEALNAFCGPVVRKRSHELRFWRRLKRADGHLANRHYPGILTASFEKPHLSPNAAQYGR